MCTAPPEQFRPSGFQRLKEAQHRAFQLFDKHDTGSQHLTAIMHCQNVARACTMLQPPHPLCFNVCVMVGRVHTCFNVLVTNLQPSVLLCA